MTAPEGQDLTQPGPAGAAVPQPDAEPDRQSTLDAAANPSNTPVDDGPDPTLGDPTAGDPTAGDPTVGERADPALRDHGPR